MSLKERLEAARKRLSKLNLGNVLHDFRKNQHIRTARRAARKEFKHKRNHILDRIDALVKDGANPDGTRILELEHEVKHLDQRIGELHSRITRAIERIAELGPKVTKRQKRKKRILAAIRKLRKQIRDQKPPPEDADHFMTMDGKVVPEWIGKINLAARAAGRWAGVVISGYRTPEYSEQLCYAMCGQPSCPGMCAGRLTNHACPPSNTGVYPEGAEDVSDPEGLDNHCQATNAPLIGNGRRLPNDKVHFSHEGN